MRPRLDLNCITHFATCAVALLCICLSTSHASAAEKPLLLQPAANSKQLAPASHELNTTLQIGMVTSPIYSQQKQGGTTNSATRIGFGTSYNYTVLSPYLQWGAEFDFAYVQKNIDQGSYGLIKRHGYLLSLLFGPTINFGAADIRRTYFVGPRIGVRGTIDKEQSESFGAIARPVPNSGTHQYLAFAYGVNFGKRFSLNDYVSYTPSVGVIGSVREGYKDVTVVANILSFSFFPEKTAQVQ